MNGGLSKIIKVTGHALSAPGLILWDSEKAYVVCIMIAVVLRFVVCFMCLY